MSGLRHSDLKPKSGVKTGHRSASSQSIELQTSDRLVDHPCDYAFYYEQGDELANRECYAEALAYFDHVLALNPEYVPALTYRAAMLIHLEQYEEALFACDRALALQPDDAEGWLFRGVALQRLGRYKQAYRSYDQALDAASDPESPQKLSLGQQLRQWKQQFLKGFSALK